MQPVVLAVPRPRTNDRPKVSRYSLPFVNFVSFRSKIFSSALLLSIVEKFGVKVRASSRDFDHPP